MFRPETIADPELFKPEPTVEFWDTISKQDWEICERAQTGVSSRAFTRGRLPAPGPVPVLVQRGMAPRDGPPHPGLTTAHPASMRILRA